MMTHERDSRIQFFEEEHKYIIDDSPEVYTSVTTFIGSFFEKFNADDVIFKMIRNGNFSKKYKGHTREQVKEMWETNKNEACRLGTLLHKSIEDTFQNIPIDYNTDEIKKEYTQFLQFVQNTKDTIIPHRFEWRIFDETHKIAGSIDAVFTTSDGKYMIYDWKRVKEIKKDNKFQSAKKPISHIPDTNYHHYCLQLSLYRYILETNYSIEIAELALVVFQAESEDYQFIQLPYLKQEIVDMLNWNKCT